MASVKDLIVNGVARIVGKVYSSGGFVGNLEGTSSNASKVNNLTVQTAVPANAVFTDTKAASSLTCTSAVYGGGSATTNVQTALTNLSLAIGIPAGTVQMYAGNSVPNGWLLCNGQAVSRTTYSALFTAISTSYGTGNGSTTFNVPDFRESAPVGAGQWSAVTGQKTHTITTHDSYNIGEFKDDQYQGHWHHIRIQCDQSGGAGYAKPHVNSTRYTQESDNWVRQSISDGTNGTPRIGATTHGKQLGINFIIKY